MPFNFIPTLEIRHGGGNLLEALFLPEIFEKWLPSFSFLYQITIYIFVTIFSTWITFSYWRLYFSFSFWMIDLEKSYAKFTNTILVYCWVFLFIFPFIMIPASFLVAILNQFHFHEYWALTLSFWHAPFGGYVFFKSQGKLMEALGKRYNPENY